MPYRCSLLNCVDNGDDSCQRYRLPGDSLEQKLWTDKIPNFKEIKVKDVYFRVCSRHWPPDPPMVKVRGGKYHPKLPPSLFNVTVSSLPTPKPPQKRKTQKFEVRHQEVFLWERKRQLFYRLNLLYT